MFKSFIYTSTKHRRQNYQQDDTHMNRRGSRDDWPGGITRQRQGCSHQHTIHGCSSAALHLLPAPATGPAEGRHPFQCWRSCASSTRCAERCVLLCSLSPGIAAGSWRAGGWHEQQWRCQRGRAAAEPHATSAATLEQRRSGCTGGARAQLPCPHAAWVSRAGLLPLSPKGRGVAL